MNILMMTNTFTPHVGGVARSVQGFAAAFRRQGHRVLVAAPWFKGAPENEPEVIRFPTVQDFNGSEFSVPVPEPLRLLSTLKTLQPDVVHSHHPFLLGGTALRVAATHDLPLVFTHHTMYDKYTHYVAADSPTLKRFIVDLVTGYCNLCDAVIAPSETVAEILRDRGVTTPITIIPTGVNAGSFSRGDGAAFRAQMGLPLEAFVVGHVGRLAPEKNLEFLTEAVSRLLARYPPAYFLVVGSGPLKTRIRAAFESRGLASRLRMVGFVEQDELACAYGAMDVFAFASHSETQGMVLSEAMAAGVPIVAVEAPGVREIVTDGYNGRLLRRDDVDKFASALHWVASSADDQRLRLAEHARATAANIDMDTMAARTLDLYRSLIETAPSTKMLAGSAWEAARRRLKGEWQILSNVLRAAADSVRPSLVWEVGPTGFGEALSYAGALGVDTAPAVKVPQPDEINGGGRPYLRARILGWFWAWFLRLQCVTWKKHYEGLTELDRMVGEGRKILFCFWHGKYVPLFALLRGRPCCVFTSESPRGAVVAEICRRFGYECVQVPTQGRGAYGLELMKRALARHQNGGIAVDGPMGPYHRVKRGVIKLASDLDYTVVPASVCVRRKRVVKHRWDRLELPVLFTRVGFAIGGPMEIPRELSPEQVQSWATKLRDALESLDRRAEKLVADPAGDGI